MRIILACGNCNAQYDASGKQPGECLRCRCGAKLCVPPPAVRDARLVRCASCGSVRSESGDHCEFCGARFSVADKGWGSMCPKCCCRLPDDAQFCVECGLKIEPLSLNSTPSTLLCPRCNCALHSRRLEKLDLFECGGCGGLWLPNSVFDAICREHEARGAAVRILGDTKPRTSCQVEEHVRYIPCPVCEALMNRRNFGSLSGVVIDSCREHGVWLDNQELGCIVQFIESGGLDRTRENEQREQERLEKQRKRDAVKNAPLVLGSLGKRPAAPDDIYAPWLVRMAAEIARLLSSRSY